MNTNSVLHEFKPPINDYSRSMRVYDEYPNLENSKEIEPPLSLKLQHPAKLVLTIVTYSLYKHITRRIKYNTATVSSNSFKLLNIMQAKCLIVRPFKISVKGDRLC